MTSPFRSLLLGAALMAAAAAPALAQTNVNISIGQPGFFGLIDMGGYNGRPVVYAEQPVIVREVRHVHAEPVYLRVPSHHRKSWSRYCGRYDACGRPVMFVRDDWYANTYAPRYRERHHGYREVRHEVRGDRHDDRDDDRRDKHDKHDKRDKHDKHGKGHDKHGHGNGHGRGH